jgi:hypothetical protein
MGLVPLYWRAAHNLLRWTTLGMLAFSGLCALVIGGGGLANGQFEGLIFVVFFVAMALAITRTTLRAKPLFGSARGLWLRDGAGWRVIPWTQVENVDYPLSSINPVFRVYRIHVKGERSIHFLPGSRELAAIEEFRRAAK